MIDWESPIEWNDGTPAKLCAEIDGKISEHRGHPLRLIELMGVPVGFPSGYVRRTHIYVFERGGSLPEHVASKLYIVNVSTEKIVAKMNEAMEGDALWGMF